MRQIEYFFLLSFHPAPARRSIAGYHVTTTFASMELGPDFRLQDLVTQLFTFTGIDPHPMPMDLVCHPDHSRLS